MMAVLKRLLDLATIGLGTVLILGSAEASAGSRGGARSGSGGNFDSTRKEPSQRTVGSGVVPDRHNLNVHDKGDKAGTFKRIVSGLPPAERAQYGNNAQFKAHTEPKALQGLKAGQRMVMVGQKPPCNRCQGEIRDAVQKTGGSVDYMYRKDGYTVRITYQQTASGHVQRTTSIFDAAAGSRTDSVRIFVGGRWQTPAAAGQAAPAAVSAVTQAGKK